MNYRLVTLAALAVALLMGCARKVNEGVVDAGAYASLQAALDAVPESGGIVRLPPGTFEITEPLVLTREHVRIEGAGMASHIQNRNESGEPALVLRGPEAGERIWRVEVANLRISGNPKSGDGLRAEGVNELFVHGVSVDHNGGNGIHMIDCYEDPRIADSLLTYNGAAGLHIQAGHDIVVNGNQFEENQDALRCIDSFNLCMNGNNIDDHLRHGVVIENTYGSVVSGNMIEECAGTAIVVDRDAYGITLSANVLAHNNGGGIDLRDAWGSTVSANTFTINPGWSVRIGPDSGRITVTGNNFSNSYIGGRTVREEDYTAEWPRKGFAAGVLLEGASDVALSGNVFAGLIEEAVVLRGAQRVTLVGNVASDLGRSKKLPEGPVRVERSRLIVRAENQMEE